MRSLVNSNIACFMQIRFDEDVANQLRKLVIFDVEGTLIDNVKATVLSWHQTFHQHGYQFSVSALQRHFGRDPDEMIRALLPASDAARRAPSLKETQRSCYRQEYLAREGQVLSGGAHPARTREANELCRRVGILLRKG